MTQSDLQQKFDNWAEEYDDDVREDGVFPFDGYDRVLARILDLSDVGDGMSVLELGVGTGNLTSQLAQRGGDVWGVDFSAEMLARAHEKAPRATLAQVNLLEPLPANFKRPFDRIVSSYVLHELPLVEKLALLNRLVESHFSTSGLIVIGDVGFKDAVARKQAEIEAGDRWVDEYFWLEDETQEELARAGWAMTWEQISSCAFVLTIGPMSKAMRS